MDSNFEFSCTMLDGFVLSIVFGVAQPIKRITKICRQYLLAGDVNIYMFPLGSIPLELS